MFDVRCSMFDVRCSMFDVHITRHPLIRWSQTTIAVSSSPLPRTKAP
jgi:hypothetical protein